MKLNIESITLRFASRGFTPSSLSIRAGSSYHASGGVTTDIIQVIEHHSYDYRTLDYDYALIELNEPLNFTDSIKTVAIADSDVADGTVCVTSGWGEFFIEKIKSNDLF